MRVRVTVHPTVRDEVQTAYDRHGIAYQSDGHGGYIRIQASWSRASKQVLEARVT